jgi:peptidylprolyl isomerase
MPGLGLALVGLAAGQSTTLRVPAEQAYGLCQPNRIRRLDRRCFRPSQALPIGKWVRVLDRRRRRWVRIVEVHPEEVVVDTNHRWAGLALQLEVELLSIQGLAAGPEALEPEPGKTAEQA